MNWQRATSLWRERSLVVAAVAVLLLGGCAQQRYVTLRDRPQNVLANPLRLIARGGPRPTERTLQLLRRYDLLGLQEKSPQVTLTKLQQQIAADPDPDKICSFAELSYIAGQRFESQNKPKDALDNYGAAVAHAYWFLLDPGLDRFRNPYDPEFRRACDIYNESLAAAMRIVIKANRLRPGETQVIQTGKQQLYIETVLRGAWHAEDIERLEFVDDYQIEGGLTNQYHTYGLGVPLIAVRAKHAGESPEEKYYPPGLSFPVTAFLHVQPQTPEQAAANVHHCTLELYDPMISSDIAVCNRLVPLETDLTTPLAFFLGNPAFQEREKDLATFGL